MNEGLTERQRRILEFIRSYISEHGYPPSNREIGRAVGITSTSVVDYNLRRMERKGLLTCDPRVSRGIKLAGEVGRAMGRILSLPIYGGIPASPLNTPADLGGERINVVPDLVREDCFALRVRGDSMIGDHINDGDIVIVQPQATAQNGDIVVALVDNEVTLKRFYREKDRIRLQPSNPSMEPIYVSPDQVQIQGKVITVIRQVA
jgi:repressor LexA